MEHDTCEWNELRKPVVSLYVQCLLFRMGMVFEDDNQTFLEGREICLNRGNLFRFAVFYGETAYSKRMTRTVLLKESQTLSTFSKITEDI